MYIQKHKKTITIFYKLCRISVERHLVKETLIHIISFGNNAEACVDLSFSSVYVLYIVYITSMTYSTHALSPGVCGP